MDFESASPWQMDFAMQWSFADHRNSHPAHAPYKLCSYGDEMKNFAGGSGIPTWGRKAHKLYLKAYQTTAAWNSLLVYFIVYLPTAIVRVLLILGEGI